DDHRSMGLFCQFSCFDGDFPAIAEVDDLLKCFWNHKNSLTRSFAGSRSLNIWSTAFRAVGLCCCCVVCPGTLTNEKLNKAFCVRPGFDHGLCNVWKTDPVKIKGRHRPPL